MTIEIEAGASQHQCSMKSLYRPSFFEQRFLDPFLVWRCELKAERRQALRFPDKLISLFLRQVDLASASESLRRGLGSNWFTERLHRNALVTHFQHGQVFCTARQLKDYAVTRCRLHQRAPQR